MNTKLHVAITNNSVITSESVKLALNRLNPDRVGVSVEYMEVLPFPRLVMNYIYKYNLDLVIMDYEMDKQDIPMYVQRIKAYNPSIKIILLAKIITPELITLTRRGIVDAFTTLPFQDANLWNAIERIYHPERFPEEVDEAVDEEVFVLE